MSPNLLTDLGGVIGDAFFEKQKFARAMNRGDGAEVARLLTAHASLSDDFHARGLGALARLGAPGIKRLLLEMRSGAFYHTADTIDNAACRGRATACLAQLFPAVEAAGLVSPALQAFALTALSDEYEFPRKQAQEALRAWLPRVPDVQLYTRLRQAAEAVVQDEGDPHARPNGQALLELLAHQSVPAVSPAPSTPLTLKLDFQLSRITVRNVRMELVEARAMSGKPEGDLQKAIGFANTQEYKYAAQYFGLAASDNLHPLFVGYARAEEGVMRVKLKDLPAACGRFWQVLETKSVLVEGAHQAASYMRVFLDAAGWTNKSALLALLEAQTSTLLGYHLRPEGEREAHELVQMYLPG